MANKLLWATAETTTTLLGIELNSVSAGGASTLGAEYSNQTNKFRFATLEMVVDWDTTGPTAGGVLTCHLFPAVDGTNYINSTAADLSLSTVVGWFTPATILTPQRLLLRSAANPMSPIIELMPMKYKAMIINDTDQALTASGHTLKITPFNEELQ